MLPTRKVRHWEPARPKPEPDRAEIYAQLGLNVTICIAAKLPFVDAIVAVSDQRLSYDDNVETSDSGTFKDLILSSLWSVLFSGNNISPVLPIRDAVRAKLKPTPPNEISLAVIRDAVCTAYREAVQQQIVGQYLSKYGFKSVEDFRREGLENFGADQFGDLCQKIEKFDLGISLLVYGFDNGLETPGSHIFEVKHPGISVDNDLRGYGIIGSGFWPALASLARNPYWQNGIEQAVYALCEAKFCAESASGVGRATLALILNNEGHVDYLTRIEVDALRKVWKEARPVQIPEQANEIIKGRLDSSNKSRRST